MRAGCLAPVMAVLLLGCTDASCPPLASSRMQVAELFFGRNAIDDAMWASFAADTLSEQFPDGFTVLDGRGQWRAGPASAIVREPSTLVIVAAPDTPATRERLAAVIEAYRTRFAQQSVGLVMGNACAAF